jgi:F-type H+-transporting ATPase subunit epsilon
MGKLYLEVVTPEGVLVSQEVDAMVAPGTEGEFGVLPDHVLFLSGLVPGELRYKSGSVESSMVVTTGFAEVSNDKVSVLVDAAEKTSEIDRERAQRAIERARARLAKERGSEDVDFVRAELALQRAIARLKAVDKII